MEFFDSIALLLFLLCVRQGIVLFAAQGRDSVQLGLDCFGLSSTNQFAGLLADQSGVVWESDVVVHRKHGSCWRHLTINA